MNELGDILSGVSGERVDEHLGLFDGICGASVMWRRERENGEWGEKERAGGWVEKGRGKEEEKEN